MKNKVLFLIFASIFIFGAISYSRADEPQPPTCGNGTIEAGETCDDENVMPNDGCSNICAIEAGWQCSGVPSLCTLIAQCGNGTVEQGEECDDANSVNNDSCDNACHNVILPVCGNGAMEQGESCDDGNAAPGDGCDASCQVEIQTPTDTDADGIPDTSDNCVAVANSNQADADNDGIGDVCDVCVNAANADQIDADNDKIGDTCDNCPLTANADQADDDHDGIGNACDPYHCISTGAEVCGDEKDNDCDGLYDEDCAGDIIAPSIRIDSPDEGSEVSGNISISTYGEEDDSLIKNVCIFYGVENPDTPISENNCKNLDQREWYSWNYAPNHTFSWNTASTTDGTYKIYAVATDNAGNVATSSARTISINNYSLGTPGNPAKITNCQELQDVRNHLRWHYTIENDIDCSETRTWNGGNGFLEIGHNNQFTGKINGKNHIVSNLYINSSENRGIFGAIQGAVIENVVFKDVDVKCRSTYCAVLVNTNWGTISRVGITGKLACSGKCGGFASQNSGTISQSWADLEIISLDSGYGGPGYAGIIAGQNYGGSISNCYAKGSLTATQGGGIVGLNENTNVFNSYSVAKIAKANDWSGSAGLIGWQYQGGSQTNSYWNKETSGQDIMCGSTQYNSPESCNDANGMTDSEAKTGAKYVGFDFEGIWAIDSSKNDGYPYFGWQTFWTQKDDTNPIITVLGDNPKTVYLGDIYTDAGATAIDNVDGDITASIEVKNMVNTSVIGTYLVTYDVMDAKGNEANQMARTVNVVAKPAAPIGGGGGGMSPGQIDPSFGKIKPMVLGVSTSTKATTTKSAVLGVITSRGELIKKLIELLQLLLKLKTK